MNSLNFKNTFLVGLALLLSMMCHTAYAGVKIKVECPTPNVSINFYPYVGLDKGYYKIEKHLRYVIAVTKTGYKPEYYTLEYLKEAKIKLRDGVFKLNPLMKYPESGWENRKLDCEVHFNTDALKGTIGVYTNFDSSPQLYSRLDSVTMPAVQAYYGSIGHQINSNLAHHDIADTTSQVFKDNSKTFNVVFDVADTDYYYATYAYGATESDNDLAVCRVESKFSVLSISGDTLYSKNIIQKSTVMQQSNPMMALADALERALLKILDDPALFESFANDEKARKEESTLDHIVINSPSSVSSGIADFLQSTVTVMSKDAYGSGCVISNDGYIVSNFHVVGNEKEVEVVLYLGDTIKAEVIRINRDFDLALLKANMSNIKAFSLKQTQQVKLADKVYVVGTPADLSLGQSVSSGIISAKRNLFGKDYYQTDARVNRGNSGGALVNQNGELIGIVSSKISGLGVEGIGFAIPVKYIEDNLRVTYK